MFNKIIKPIIIAILVICIIDVNCFAATRREIDIDSFLIKAMKAFHVPVVGYAIINDNKIVSAKTISIDSNIHVSVNSLFQAASISKSVSAYGTLKLISQGKFKLSDPANKLLKSWKIPKKKFNRHDPISIKQILNMTSGLSVSGYPGYTQGRSLPSLIDILNGAPPANSPPIRVF